MWFWLALLSAGLGAVDVILNKALINKVSAALISWALFALTIPILIVITLIQGIPSFNLFFALAIIDSSLTYVFARTIINDALKENLLSQIYPLTAFGGLFTYIFGLMFLSEDLRLIPVLGLLSIILGSYILNADQAKEDILKPFKLLFMTKKSLLLISAIALGGLTAIMDKAGLDNTLPVSPVFVLLLEQIVMTLLLTFYLQQKEKSRWVTDFKTNWKFLTLNSLIYLLVSLAVFYAYADNGPVALVIGIKRLQIFFILILGFFLFKDRPTKHSWIATFIMVLGVLMIKLG